MRLRYKDVENGKHFLTLPLLSCCPKQEAQNSSEMMDALERIRDVLEDNPSQVSKIGRDNILQQVRFGSLEYLAYVSFSHLVACTPGIL
jgi:hypothetical protein